MTDAELHIALREVVSIGRRGGYDADEVAEKLAGVVRDYAAHQLRHAADDSAHTGFTDLLNMRADELAPSAAGVADCGTKIEKLRLRLDHERKKNATLREELNHIEQEMGRRAAVPETTSFIDARVLEEAKKAARHDREQVAYLEKKLDLAERALRGLGLMFT